MVHTTFPLLSQLASYVVYVKVTIATILEYVMLLTHFIVMCAGTDKPNMILLNNHVRGEAAPQWHKLGEQLLMSALTHKLDVIEEEYNGDNKRCCSEMLTHWLDDDFKATWNKMLHTLEQNGHSQVVTSIKKHDTIKGLQTASYCCRG